MADYNWIQKGLGYGLGITLDPKWSWEDKESPTGPVKERPNIEPAPDRIINASGESMLSPSYVRWMEKYGYDYNPDGTPKYDIGYDPIERAKSIGQDKYQPNRMSPSEMAEWKKGYDEEKRIKDENDAKKAEEERLAKEEAEYRDTFKGRLQTLFEDSGKRDAILSGISETMLETRYGKDVYGSRMADVSKNVRSKLREDEALSMVKDQAILDMMKTQAETASINNPMQFLSNTQKNARDYATAQGAIANPPFAQGSKEWAAAYAQGLENMAMENLIMAPVEGIAAINELLARNTGMFDEDTIKVFKDVIANLTGRITGDGGATTTQAGTIYGTGTSEDGVSG